MAYLDEKGFFGLPLNSPIELRIEDMAFGQNPMLHNLANIIREFPDDLLFGRKKFLPCTAYMSPVREPQSFIEEISQSSGHSVLDSIDKVLVSPVFNALEQIVTKSGLSLEPHAQNLLLELDPSGYPTGLVIFRDFGSIWLDPLRAFLDAPDLLHTLMDCNGWVAISPNEAAFARMNICRSIGSNFVYYTAYRALAALIIRKKIGDLDAQHVSQLWRSRVSTFIQSYFGNSVSFDPLRVKLAPKHIVDQELFPTVHQLTRVRSATDEETKFLNSIVNQDRPHTGEVMPVCWFDREHRIVRDLSWLSHPNGFIGIHGERVIALLMPRAGHQTSLSE
jgi:hypothetical protein